MSEPLEIPKSARHYIKARVFNDGPEDHIESFRGDKLLLKPGKPIIMDYHDAVQFKGQFYPKLNAKRIRVEPLTWDQCVSAGIIKVKNDTGSNRNSGKATA